MATTTRLRAQIPLAFLSQKVTLKWLFMQMCPRPRGQKIGQLSDRLARDVGLSAAQMERHRLQLPSQTTHHPRG